MIGLLLVSQKTKHVNSHIRKYAPSNKNPDVGEFSQWGTNPKGATDQASSVTQGQPAPARTNCA